MSALSAPRPGGAAWLIRHEVRLAWRTAGGRKARLLLWVMGFVSLGLHGAAWWLLHDATPGDLPPAATYLLGLVTWVGITLMLAQAISASVAALFDRGDLDLLLSSPLPTRTVFLARGLGIATGVSAFSLFVLAPVANVGLLTGHPELLAIYPSLLAIALAVTAIGLWLTLLLVRWIGARKARSVAQVLGTLIGASIFMAGQATNLLGRERTHEVAARLVEWTQPGGPLAVDSLVWWPARALQGALVPMLAIVAIGTGAFWVVVQLAHRRFLAGTQESVTGSARRGQAAPRAGSTRFRRGLWRIVLVKEWRLILRDPQVIGQTLLQIVYLVPLFFVIARSSTQSVVMLVPAVVYLASFLAGNIAWITVAAEDDPDLLGNAPVPLARLRALKVLAALLPVWALMLPIVGFVAWARPLEGLIFVACLAGATGSVGIAQVWYPRQGKRTDLKKRMQGHGVLGWLEMVLTGGWVGLAYCLGSAPAWTPLALLAVVVGGAAIWSLGRARRDDDAQTVA